MRMRRSKTIVVSWVFDLETLFAASIPIGGKQYGAAAQFGSQLPAYIVTTGANTAAANYAFIFNLSRLYSSSGSYQAFAPFYEWFKLKKVQLTLKVGVDPKRDINIPYQAGTPPTGSQYNFTNTMTYDPDLTLIDYDGLQLPFSLGGNGDATQIVYNRTGVRRHRAFGTIRRTFYPRFLDVHPLVGSSVPGFSLSDAYPIVSSGGGTNPQMVSVSQSRGRRAGWCRTSQDNSFLGTVHLFSSYKGPDAGSGVASNPIYTWAIQVKWFVSARDTIYG